MRTLQSLVVLLLTVPVSSLAAQALGGRLFLVPGVHYSTPARTSFALTAFIDGRRSTVGKGYIAKVEAGRDAMRAHFGIANVSSPVGYSAQLSGMQTRSQPLDAMPNSRYVGTEFHVYLSVVNLGAGFYAPVGAVKGRKGLLALSAGLGF